MSANPLPYPAMTSDPAESEAPTATTVLCTYAAPSVGIGFMWGIVGLYFMKFSTDVLLVAPASIGLVLGASRLWDGITDPLIGWLSDRTRSRMGRRRPWLLASATPVAVAFVAIWNPPQGLAGGALTAWMLASLLFFYLALTLFNIPHKALGAELAAGYHDRSRLFAARAVAENLGTIIAAVALGLLENAEDVHGMALLVALSGGGITAALMVGCAVRLRERPENQGRGGHKAPFAAFADVLRNPSARILLGVFFFELFGHQVFVVSIPYGSQYVLGTPGSTSLYLGIALVTTLLTIPFWVAASRRLGKSRAWGISLVMKAVVFAGLFQMGVGDQAWVIALVVVYGAAASCGAVLGPSIKADVVDSDEAATGERKEGVFFSAWNLSLKSAIALAMAVCGWVLASSGFAPGVEQSETALLGIRALLGPIPLAFHLVAASLLLRLHLDEAEHRRLREVARRLASTQASLVTPRKSHSTRRAC